MIFSESDSAVVFCLDLPVNPLVDSTTLEVRQSLEWVAAQTGLEPRDRFIVSDSKHGPILFAVEEGRRASRLVLMGIRAARQRHVHSVKRPAVSIPRRRSSARARAHELRTALT
jgi:hypothetical protein